MMIKVRVVAEVGGRRGGWLGERRSGAAVGKVLQRKDFNVELSMPFVNCRIHNNGRPVRTEKKEA